MSIMDTKLRSFNITSSKTYERFRQIQLERGKNVSKRLNELIEKEVKEADPDFKQLNAVRSKDTPDIITPNPFLKTQTHSLPEWEQWLKTKTIQEGNEILNHLIALKELTKSFEDYRLD
jgi:organic radical activating enzyme